MLCLAPVSYPKCAALASVLVNIIYVKQFGAQRLCFYEYALPNCTMPQNLTTANGFFPVKKNLTYSQSHLHGEAVLTSVESNYVVPVAIKRVFITAKANGSSITIDNAGVSIIGLENHHIKKITVNQKNPQIINVSAETIEFKPGIDFSDILVQNVVVKNVIEFSPTTLRRYVSLDNAKFVNVSGNYVAILHHRGTVTSDNSKIIWLNQISGSGNVVTKNGGEAFNVASLTGIFGPEYEVEYEAGSIVYQSQEASALANALILPTVLSVVVVLFSQGDKLRWRR